MRIGIISDTHDHIDNLSKAREFLVKHQVHAVIHCGDLCAPFMIDELDLFKIPVHVVFGNIDDRHTTTLKANTAQHVQLHGDIGYLTFDGVRFGVNHYPDIAKALGHTGKFDVVCSGHTHVQSLDDVGGCLLVNPGELMGRFGTLSCALYDTNIRKVKFFDL